MPCHDNYPEQGRAEERERLDKATRIACEAIGLLEAHDLENNLSFEALDWWQDHLEKDKERKKEEARNKRVEEVNRKLKKLEQEMLEEIDEEFC